MDKLDLNIQILKDFVEQNKLESNHSSSIHFTCGFEIETEKNYQKVDCYAFIYFDNFNDAGKVVVICDLEPQFYPTTFLAKFSDMLLEYGILTITGYHSKNSDIGEHKAIITPYERID